MASHGPPPASSVTRRAPVSLPALARTPRAVLSRDRASRGVESLVAAHRRRALMRRALRGTRPAARDPRVAREQAARPLLAKHNASVMFPRPRALRSTRAHPTRAGHGSCIPRRRASHAGTPRARREDARFARGSAWPVARGGGRRRKTAADSNSGRRALGAGTSLFKGVTPLRSVARRISCGARTLRSK
jgi:hypothetical protein